MTFRFLTSLPFRSYASITTTNPDKNVNKILLILQGFYVKFRLLKHFCFSSKIPVLHFQFSVFMFSDFLRFHRKFTKN